MTARPSLGPGSGTISGPDFFGEYEGAMAGLFDASRLPLTSVAGTADDVTATCAWDLSALVDGMCFGITWGGTNTGGMTLAINGLAAVPVLTAAGGAMPVGVVEAGVRSTLEYIGGEFRVLSPIPTSGSVGIDIAGLAFGAVGTYCFAIRPTASVSAYEDGTTYSGAALLPAGVREDSSSTGDLTSDTVYSAALMAGGSALSGTWRAMGRAGDTANRRGKGTLFLRIA